MTWWGESTSNGTLRGCAWSTALQVCDLPRSLLGIDLGQMDAGGGGGWGCWREGGSWVDVVVVVVLAVAVVGGAGGTVGCGG